MQCLEMPARTFFRVLKEAKELKVYEQNQHYVELCDIAACANSNAKYIQSLKDYYQAFLFSYEKGPDYKAPSNPRVLDAGSNEAGRQLLALAKAKMKLSGLQ